MESSTAASNAICDIGVRQGAGCSITLTELRVAGVGVRGDLWFRPRCAISGSSVNNSSMPGVSVLPAFMVSRLLDSVLCVDVGVCTL